MVFTFQHGDRPLPGYTIERGVGRGGFGEVYFAKSDGGKEVAVKFLRDNPQIELRGVAHCLNLKSPHLVAIHDVRQSESGDSYVIMEYVNGPSLRDLMSDQPEGLGKEKAVYFLREICKGLAYLHDCGIVHRDLKPGNIFYEDGYVKIGDYGLAKLMASSQHSGQTVSVGTVHYMAPEVGSGNYDRTIDIYAMGVMLYEMLLGRVPFSGSSMGEVLMKHLTAQPTVDELPAPFPAVIRKALAKDPKDRYQSVREMMDDVFSVEDINQSVASFDTMGLSRMAARVADRVRLDAGARVAVGVGGSSNVRNLGGGSTPPPPVIPNDNPNRGSGLPAVDRIGNQIRRIAGGKDGENFLDIPNSQSLPQRDRVTTGLLGLFLGAFGVHRFYTGHNAIGVMQIVVTCLTGVGALWGIIESVRILCGAPFEDAMGRPLLGSPPRDPLRRSAVIRATWGVIGTLGLLGGVGLCLAGLFAPADYALWYHDDGGSIFFNALYFMILCGFGVFALGVFATWKASHRGGLSLWRASIRPAGMCLTAALAGAALAMQRLILPAPLQAPVIILFALFSSVFFVFWLLRGNHLILKPSDAYWSRSWMRIFAVIAVASASLAIFAVNQWDQVGMSFDDTSAAPYENVRTTRSNNGRYRLSDDPIRVRKAIYHQEPLILFASLGLMVCSGLESWYRRSLIDRAAEIAADGNTLPREG